MNVHDKPEISAEGWKIISCLQAFLSTTDIREAIDQYRRDGEVTNRGCEAIVKMHLFSFLIDVFGRLNVIAEESFKYDNQIDGRKDTGRYDFVVKVANAKIAIELKAFATKDDHQYDKDYAKLKQFACKCSGVENHKEAFFVHYNLDIKCCQSQQILDHMKDIRCFDGSTSYVITEKKVCNVSERGCLSMAPSFFLTFHRTGIKYQFGQ